MTDPQEPIVVDYDFETALEKRATWIAVRDEAEEARKAIDEDMKPPLAILGGKYESPQFSATLVDRVTVTWDQDGIKKALLLAGVPLGTITAAWEANRKGTASTSVSAKRRDG